MKIEPYYERQKFTSMMLVSRNVKYADIRGQFFGVFATVYNI